MRLLTIFLIVLLSGCGSQYNHLQRVLQSGELVVLTRNSATTYYEGTNGPTGLEYDLALGFANYLGVRLKLLPPSNLSDVLKRIQKGKADLAAAGLTVTPKRQGRINFGPSYQYIRPQVVYRVGTPVPRSLDDIQGELEVVANSSHAEQLAFLREKYPKLRYRENAEIDSEQLLLKVWEQEINYTISDSNEIAINQRFYPELRVAFDINTPEPLAWAFPPGEDRSLIKKANTYFEQLDSSGELAKLLERYYGHVNKFDYVGVRRFMKHVKQRLPQYQKMFINAAKESEMDWRLVAAVGYQESHWNPKAVSPTGVRGIMMLTQNTMAQLGISARRSNAKASIEGGARYLSNVKSRIPKRIPEPDRTWMTLAAYNVGFGHLEDARLLTQSLGDNPDEWIDVKQHLPLLSQEKWHQKTRHGYARGHEPVRYVENVRSYYDILVWLTNRQKLLEDYDAT